MNFLAIDTSGKRLTVVACKNDKKYSSEICDCLHAHSVRLMEEIENVLHQAELTPAECDFFCAVVGAGSFTGIRIGISTVKGLCLACGKPALAVTSFDTLAYAERNGKTLALVDAGRGFYYACAYGEDGEEKISPRYLSTEEVTAIINEGYTPVSGEPLSLATKQVNPAEGLFHAAAKKHKETAPAQTLAALYLRKSSAEENAK
ncbi:MAG: tRNA (adenosine(37)-N6)-threonylcarbamoyltransferase complex dimerization subunit type 1 TsaB [Clostridiales bacterium]|nr:tRNA (adenosine(37)-N6)-threonylcarbamoyltransferase complex dimerization subunit type 1 TsaB [Clostridiales bacterium]